MTNENNELYMEAIELSKRFDKRFIELARTLRLLKAKDPDMFRLCVDNSNISRRKAYYVLEVAETFEQFHIPNKWLHAIGWTKLQVIAKHLTKDNLEDALNVAEKATTRDLKLWMKGEWSEAKPHCVLMYLSGAQYEELAEAVLSHGGGRGPRGLFGKEEAIISLIQAHKKLLAQLVDKSESV